MTSSQDLPNFLHQDKNVTIITSKILELPPSCIEFLPDDPKESSGYFIVGTYHLEQNPVSHVPAPIIPSRKGSLILFKLNFKEIELIQTISYPSAILDLHFHEIGKVFAVASSTGCISIFHLVKRQGIYEIEFIITHQVVPEDILVLSLTWNSSTDFHDPEQPSLLFFTISSGSVLAITLSTDFKNFKFVNDGAPLTINDDNVWTCAVSRNALFSGSDDSRLSRIELPDDLHFSCVGTEIFDRSKNPRKDQNFQVDFKVHDAGVTAILILPTPSMSNHDNFLVTGSYDDHIRILAIANSPTPKSSDVQKLAKYFIGGGVWRLKIIHASFHPSNIREEKWEYSVLASCMHAGARLLKITGSPTGPWNIEVLAEMRAHQSMCYACDFQPQQSLSRGEEIPPKNLIIISTSFYDQLLIAWEWRYSASLLVNR